MEEGRSRYTGSLTIIGENDTVVFERDLTTDEIIEILLRKPAIIREADISPEPLRTVRTHIKKKEKKTSSEPKEKKLGNARHECCGSNGPRHKKECPMNRRQAGTSKNARMVANRKTAFSTQTFNTIKGMLDVGELTVGEIARNKGIDEDEVRRINLSDDYEEYLNIA